MPKLTVETVNWAERGKELFAIRFRVFCDEQGCAPEAEDDGKDAEAMHVLASQDGIPVGTGRLLPKLGKVTRIAVLASARHLGIGSVILEHLVALAEEQGIRYLYLHGQTQAIPFYEANGFAAVGPEFMEEDIPHRKMERNLP
jgi:predicted GNAT family N-acyltransferase